MTSDTFQSARRKLDRAKQHLAELKRQFEIFKTDKNLYAVFTEPDPDQPQNTVHKMRLTKHMPSGIPEITGDVVDNLRAALDHAMYAVAVAGGCVKPKNAYFPFSWDAAHFESTLKGNCKDVPSSIYPLLRSYEPYKGGSDALYALNVVCVANKHKLLVEMPVFTFRAGVNIRGTGYFNMPDPHIWDSVKNEMVLFTLGPASTFKADFQFGIVIVFGEIDIVGGKPAIPNLDLFADIVKTIIDEIEAECGRLKITA